MSIYTSQIKSTGLIGVVQLFKLFFGVVQSKILAVVLGPAGFGIWGILNTFLTTISSFAVLGIDQSGVRQIAQHSDNHNEMLYSLWIFRRVICFLSILTFSILIFFREYLSVSIFGDNTYSFDIAVVALAILFNVLALCNITILNGLRYLRYLAISQIVGFAFGATFSVFCVLYWGKDGISIFILTTYLVLSIVTYCFVAKLSLKSKRPPLSFIFKEVKELFSVGMGVAYSAMIVALSIYLTQIFIRKEFGFEWVGIYNASNTISSVYIGIILAAMGVDLLPRLSQNLNNERKFNNIVNAQMELGSLVSTLGVILVLIFAPFILKLFYSSEFINATNIIRWQILTVALRVLSFPMMYVLIVKKQTLKYIFAQTILWGGSFLMLVFLAKYIGVYAMGINFLIVYFLYLFILICFTKKNINYSSLLKRNTIVSWSVIMLTWFVNECTSGYLKYITLCLVSLFTIGWIYYVLSYHMKIDIVDLLKSKIKR